MAYGIPVELSGGSLDGLKAKLTEELLDHLDGIPEYAVNYDGVHLSWQNRDDAIAPERYRKTRSLTRLGAMIYKLAPQPAVRLAPAKVDDCGDGVFP